MQRIGSFGGRVLRPAEHLVREIWRAEPTRLLEALGDRYPQLLERHRTIVRTEFDTVFIQPDVCNGCRDCISACPYGAIGFSEKAGVAQKCTMCYDRLQANMEPACAKACPTQSIQFGPLSMLQQKADARLATLKTQGYDDAQLYGRDRSVYGGLNSFFLLMRKPEVYGLPNEQNAGLPSRNDKGGYLGALVTAVIGVFAGIAAFRQRTPEEPS